MLLKQVSFWEIAVGGVSPLPLGSIGIIGLGENVYKIYGAQSVAGKILIANTLEPNSSRQIPLMGRIWNCAHRLGLGNDRRSGIWLQGQMSHRDVEKCRGGVGMLVCGKLAWEG